MLLMHGEITGLQDLIAGLSGPRFEAGLNRGLKRVGTAIKTKAAATIIKQFNIKPTDVTSKFAVEAKDGQVLITCTSKPINLTYFDAKQYGNRSGKRLTVKRAGDSIKRSVRGKAGSFGGVSVPIEKSHTTLLPGAFIAKVKAGNKGGMNIGVFSKRSYSGRSQYIDPRNRRKTTRPYVKVNRAITPKPRNAIVNRAEKTVSSLFFGQNVQPVIENYLSSEALQVVEHEIFWAMRNES